MWADDIDSDLARIIREINRGFHPQRFTTSQRDLLTSLYLGKIIYNMTTNKLNVYTNLGWQEIQSV